MYAYLHIATCYKYTNKRSLSHTHTYRERARERERETYTHTTTTTHSHTHMKPGRKVEAEEGRAKDIKESKASSTSLTWT